MGAPMSPARPLPAAQQITSPQAESPGQDNNLEAGDLRTLGEGRPSSRSSAKDSSREYPAAARKADGRRTAERELPNPAAAN